MENKDKQRYFQFPLMALRDLFINKNKTLNDVIDWGLYGYSKKIKYELADVAEELLKYYNQEKENLSKVLLDKIEYFIKNGLLEIENDGADSFSIETVFKNEANYEQILSLFETNPDFMNKAIRYYQIRKAYKFLGIIGNYHDCLTEDEKIEGKIPEHEPYPSINKDLVFDFRDNNKTEFELMQFAFYIAFRSIIGKQEYCRTNKKMILSRALGYCNITQFSQENNSIINSLYAKYNKRYHFRNVLNQLELKWGIITYSYHIRGMYVGLREKITLDDMAFFAERNKKRYKIEQLKKEKYDARINAIKRLNHKTKNNNE